MTTNDFTSITGDVDIILYDELGSIKQEHHVKNLVVATGKQMLAEKFSGVSTRGVTHIALGEGSAITSSATTSLGAPLAGAVVPAVLGSSPAGTFVYTAVFPQGVGTGALTEVGEFNIDGAVETLFARTVFPVVNKQAADILAVSWTTTIN
jgi:hypothetical protein